jgi:hypothetical protein
MSLTSLALLDLEKARAQLSTRQRVTGTASFVLNVVV